MARHRLTAALLALATPALAQEQPAPVTGDAAAGLVSRTAKAEVHLVADPALNDRRAVLKLVILNRSGAPQPFGPDAVTVITTDGQPVRLATRADLVSRTAGDAPRDTSQGRATATLGVNGAGQTDVTGYTGGMSASTGGVPTDTINRAARGEDSALAAQLDAVLLKPITLAPGKADGGQLFTDRLKKKPKQLDVAVTFAGEVHRFRLDTPR